MAGGSALGQAGNSPRSRIREHRGDQFIVGVEVGHDPVGTDRSKPFALDRIDIDAVRFVAGDADGMAADGFDNFDFHEPVTEPEELAALGNRFSG